MKDDYDFMQTYTGRRINPFSIKPQDIILEDITHALSNINRYNGHTRIPMSVAHHSILVYKLMLDSGNDKPINLLYGLLHDAPEAYIGDIIRSVKFEINELYNISIVEETLFIKMLTSLDILYDKDIFKSIKKYDNMACLIEGTALMGSEVSIDNIKGWISKIDNQGAIILAAKRLITEIMTLDRFEVEREFRSLIERELKRCRS